MKRNSNEKALKKIFLVDDHPLMRKGIRALINSSEDFAVCGEAGKASEALQEIESTLPDLVVVDISLPGNGGLDLVRDIRLRFPAVRVLVLSMHDEKLYAERVLRSGALGYVMKQDPPERLLAGIETVLRGEMFLSPEVAGTLLSAFVSGVKRSNGKVGVDRLSDRELQIFEAIGRGSSTREIAEKLNLSIKTVETYRSNIKTKLGHSNSAALVHAAIHWVENEDCASSGS